ncbi:hypothetical protein N7456_002632 [Penicillium angulare]|uniref:Uncharacterized protein n=1 Tax=Penicillium angulare TaxID=116970 RepID=A0A9W9G8M4_9EURO|nr:hypothetical protein N7456_002632 [Penicillium angulare]
MFFQLFEQAPKWRINQQDRRPNAKVTLFKYFKQHATERWEHLDKNTYGTELHGYRHLLRINSDARADAIQFVLNGLQTGDQKSIA